MVGFSENEIKVIFFLFQQKKATAKEVGQMTAISFNLAQYALSNLVRRGLVECTPDKEDVFVICTKDKFLTWIDEQKNMHDGIYDRAKNDIQQFLAVMQESTWHPNVLYFEGKEGIIEIFEDMLEYENSNIYGWINFVELATVIGDYLPKYIEKRTSRNITSYDIAPKQEELMNFPHTEEMRKIKFIDNFPINGQLRLYGDNKVAFMSFYEERPVGFIFQGEIMHNLLKTVWDHAWKCIG